MVEVSGSDGAITAKSAASRKYPMQFLCDYVNAVLDGETGELLEYRHLIACPKYNRKHGELCLETKSEDWPKECHVE